MDIPHPANSHRSRRLAVLAGLLLALWTAACSPAPAPTVSTSAPSPTATLNQAPSSESTAVPPATSLPTITPTPTAMPVGEENAGLLEPVRYAGDGTLGAVAVRPDGNLFAVAGSRGIWLVDRFSLEIVDHIDLHAGAVNEIAWSPDGTRLVSAGQDGTVRIWSLDGQDDRQAALLNGHTGPVHAVAWSPDGSRIASGGEDQTIRIWDADTYRNIQTSTHTSQITSLDWHPDSDRLLIGEYDGSVSVASTVSGETLTSFFAHDGWINHVRWSPDGSAAATGGLDGILRVWDVVESRDGSLELAPRMDIIAGFTINRIAWSPDSSRVTAGGGKPYVVRTYDAASPAADELSSFETSFEGHTGPVTGLAYAPGGVLVTTSNDNTLRVWELASSTEIRQLMPGARTFTGSLLTIDWAPEGGKIATGGTDGTLRVWEKDTCAEKIAVQAHPGGINNLDWSSRGNWIATAGNDSYTRIWDATSGELVQAVRSEGGRVNAVAFSPSGSQIAAGGFFGIVQIWSAGTEQPPALLYPNVEITALGWASSGTLLAVGGSDGAIRLYDVPSASELASLSQEDNTPIAALVWEPLGGRLAAIDRRGTITLWDSATGGLLARHAGEGGTWSSLSWAPHGVLAAGSADGTVLLLDALFLQPIALKAGHESAIQALRFDQEGRNLASAASGGALAIWQVQPEPVESQAFLSSPEPGSPGSVPENQWPPGSPLSPETAPDAGQLAVIGRGTVSAFTGGGEVFAAGGGTGAWVYKTDDRTPLRYLPGRRTFGVALSPDGKLLATRELQLVRIWDIESAQLLRSLPAGFGVRNAIAWSPDGRMLAFPDRQGNVAVHNLLNGARVLSWTTGVEMRDLAWSRDGRMLAAAGGSDIWLWDLPTHTQIAFLTGHEGTVTHLAFDPTSRLLLSAGEDNTLRIWDIGDLPLPEVPQDGEEVSWPEIPSDALDIAEFGSVSALAWSEDGSKFYSAHGDRIVFEWGTTTREIQDSFPEEDTGGSSGLLLLEDGTVVPALGPLDGHFAEQDAIRWLNLGREQPYNLLFLGADARLRLMNLSDFRLDRLFEETNGAGTIVNLLSDGPYPVFRQVQVQATPLWSIGTYDPNDPQRISYLIANGISDEENENWIAAVAPDGLKLAWNDTRSTPQQIAVRDLNSNLVSTLVELPGEAASGDPLTRDLAWSPDGDLLAAGLADGSVVVWGGKDGLQRMRVQLYEEQVNAITWSPDGRLIAAAGSDGTANGGSQFIRLVQASSGRIVAELSLDFAHTALVLAFSPDGKLLASGDSTGDAQIWNVETGARLADLTGHTLHITGIAFSEDGAAIATSSKDGTVRIWGLAPKSQD